MEAQHTTSSSALVESNAQPLGVELVSSKKTNKMSNPEDLVQLALQVQKGNDFVKTAASSKLTVIAEQIRFLQQQAQQVLQDAKVNTDLHHAACNLVKKPGTTYHLYKRKSGQTYFSLLSPQDWGASCPHQFLDSYRLEHDMSWTSLDNVDQRDENDTFINKIMSKQLALPDTLSG